MTVPGTESETWRYEVRGSSLYDNLEGRELSIFEAGEILNAHQALLMKEGLWAAKAGLAEGKADRLEAEARAARLAAEALRGLSLAKVGGLMARARNGDTAAAYKVGVLDQQRREALSAIDALNQEGKTND